MALAALLALQATDNADVDLIIATGRWIAQHMRLPAADPFAFTTTGQVWIEHKWLFDLIIYSLSQLGSWAPVMFKCLLVVTILLGLLCCCKNPSQRLLVSLVYLALLVSLKDRLSERPHLMAEALLVWFYYFLHVHRHAPQRTALLLLQLLWVNIHGSFVLGLLLAGASCLPYLRQRRPLLKALQLLGGLGLICLLNPYGVQVFLAPLQHFQLSTTGAHQLAEWQAPHWQDLRWHFWLALLGVLWAASRWRQRPKLDQSVLLLAALYLGLSAYRFLMTAIILLLLLFIPALPDYCRRWRWSYSVAGIILLSLAITLPTLRMQLQSPIFQHHATGMPVASVALLRPWQPRLHIFNSFDFGGYLAAQLGPKHKIFIDGRLDLYPAKIFADYYAALESEQSWQQLVKTYNINAIVMSYHSGESRSFLLRRLQSAQWHLLQLSATAAVLIQAAANPQPQIAYRYILPTTDLRYLKDLALPQDKYAQTLSEIKRLQVEQPDFALAYLLEGQLKEYNPRPSVRSSACQAYAPALNLPDTGQIKLIMAACLGDQQQLAAALNLFRELRDDPKYAEQAWLNMGLCYAKLGLADEAKASWQELLRRYPKNQEGALYLKRLQQYLEAVPQEKP